MKPKDTALHFNVVPWMNSEQFCKVYKYLYSDNLSKKRWAVDQISVWETRCHPSLPTAVEATVCLIRAEIHDMLYRADKTFCQEADIQMLYSMGLIRFVNLTLEHHQNSYNKLTLASLASRHDLPFWLVDLRNEASHSFCPSLSTLRFAAEKSLLYLEKTFWSEHVITSKPVMNLTSGREAEITALISQFKHLQFRRSENPKLRRSLSKNVKTVIRKLGSFIFPDDREKFIDVLVQPGNFIAAEDVVRLLKPAGMVFWSDDNLSVPDELEKFWSPLLRKIHYNDLMPLFLEKLLLSQEKSRIKLCQKIAIAWALHILTVVTSHTYLAKALRKTGFLLNLRRLLYACLKGATPFSIELLNVIVAKLRNREKYSNLFCLLALNQGQFVPKEGSPQAKRKRGDGEDIVFTIEDVEEDLKEIQAKKQRTEKDVNNWFSPSITMDFSDLPLGVVLNPALPDADKDEQSSDESQKQGVNTKASSDNSFIIVNKTDGVEEENTYDIKMLPSTTRPENFDMLYRRRPKQ